MVDRRHWEERYLSDDRRDRAPSRWVLAAAAAAPNGGLAADIAGGVGRHAIPIARAGRTVVLVDFIEGAVARACAAEPRLMGVVADAAALPLADGAFTLVVVTNFLDRQVFPALVRLLAPGGRLVYETYTTEHLRLVERGEARGPSTSAYVLVPGELRSLVHPLHVLEHWEGEVQDEAGRRRVGRIVAERLTRQSAPVAPGGAGMAPGSGAR